jgi:hypothetical protein
MVMSLRTIWLLAAACLPGVALAQTVTGTPLANGVNATVGNSGPAGATQGWPHFGTSGDKSAPLANGVNATVGNSCPMAATEHFPHARYRAAGKVTTPAPAR